MRLSLCIPLCLLLVATLGSAEELPTKSIETFTVFVSPDAIPSEHYAAKEFQRHFKELTGKEIPLETNANVPLSSIVIAMSADGVSDQSIDRAPLGDEGLHLRVTTNGVLIVGGRPRGVLYGVYEFFEKEYGLRYLTWDHTHYPAPADEILTGDYEKVPQFSFRWPYYRENADHPEFATRLRVNTVQTSEDLGGKTPQGLINHSFMRLIPPEVYGKDHPEYFALVDGERKIEMGGGGPEPCVTNPAVMRIVADSVIREVEANPNMRNISCSQNDNDDYCRCATCELVNEREGTPMGSNLALVNFAAEALAQRYPHVKVGTLAYWYTRKAPKTIKPRENVQIQLCSIECCTLHAINDPNCERNREFCKDMEDWKAICNDIWIWNYNTNFSFYDLPFPNLRIIGKNVKFFSENNTHGAFMQANGNGNAGEMSELRNYVIAQCLWNPGRESWPLAEEFCRLHYGKAANTILEYLTFLHDNAEASGQHPGCFPKPHELGLNREVTLKMAQLFDRALTEAENDEVKSRVEKASICVYRALLEAGSKMEFENGRFQYVLPAGFENAPDRYQELCEKYGMDMVAETRPVTEYLPKVKAALEGYPGARIENSIWRVTIAPSENGRVVEMYHKPTKRHLFGAYGRKNVGMHLSSGELEEVGLQGYDDQDPREFTFESTDTEVVMSKTFGDGSVIKRTVKLDEKEPGKIFSETVLTHGGAEAKAYQLKMRPEFDVESKSDDANVVSAYVLGDKWVKCNEGWEGEDGPGSDLLRDSKGGKFAFFNHDKKFGVQVSYSPEEIENPRLWWRGDWEQLNLELVSKSKELGKGETLKYGYAFEYLAEAPD